MQTKGYSLIQIIFVIVIIGILAVVAIPKYINLQKNAEVRSVFKIVNDIEKSVPASFINSVALNGNDHDWNIQKYYHINGKGWSYQNGDYFKAHGKSTNNAISYQYKDKYIVWIALGLGDKRNIAIWITCGEYEDKTLIKLCNEATSSYSSKSKKKDGRDLGYKEKLITF